MILVLIVLLLAILFMGTPVGFGTGFLAILSIFMFLAPNHLMQISTIAYGQGTSIIQLIIPLFILMAEALAQGNIASDLFYVLSRWMKRLKGGLAIAAIASCTLFAALCGSSPATAAAVGRISIREMIKYGYDPRLAAGTVAAGGTLGIMIPPSITLALYGILTETSIAKLLMAGVLPGLLSSALLIFYIIFRVLTKPSILDYKGDDVVKVESSNSDADMAAAYSKPSLAQDLKLMIPPLVLIGVVLGSIYTGWVTPTEAAGVGAIGALILVLMMRRLKFGTFVTILENTAKTSCMIIFLMFGGLALGYVVSSLGIAQSMADFIIGLGTNKWLFLLATYILWLIMGCLLDPMTMVIITVPFLFDTFIALGFDPIWLGVVLTFTVEIGMITPPVGFNLFVLGNMPEVNMKQVIQGSLPFVLVLLLTLAIVTVFPGIALLLPSLM